MRLTGILRLLTMVVALQVAATAAAEVSGYRFLLPVVEAEAGDSLTLTVEGEYEQSAQGFVMAARYPAEQLAIDRVQVEGTILEAIDVDFFDVEVSPADGVLIVSALIDTLPPFDGDLIPNLGFALELFHVEVTVSPSATGELAITLEDGLGVPPVRNMFTVDNQTVPVTEFGGGSIRLPGAGITPGDGARFRRGDANVSALVDIADPIVILQFVFYGEAAPPCMVAADANDDDAIDISDPIYLLKFLFDAGPGPPPPYQSPGPDPTPGRLGCARSIPID